ncbi:hypothetical protein [Enterobacter hormaechei]|uniref:hypothetical protein n=1 Tax=Enterobacter hormaechei TaxID=158836 RepID=UPI00079BA768|nr:hypothetical protein [Enterobacter hormaechei]MCM7106775.1 hypothetical protein [Enterobacter hormaechei]MDS0936761.1 hypothetical protein [Enterobacter hormaechei]RTM66767.1 hypothetical protein EKO17_04360 [Enterobacter hormaechei subsp. xiangfangensis]SAG09866.1 Uncharacterised protein [Enterobacter hormaechei]
MMEPTNKITRQQFNDIQRAILNAANASTKDMARQSLEMAKAYRAQIRHLLDDYVDEQLSSALIYADEAAGRVKDKGRKLENVEHFLYKFKSGLTFE